MADAGVDASGDGVAMHVACSPSFGNALSATHGRMDGYLVSIVPPGGPHQCNGDSGHLHLQVKINGAIYDVAVNTDTLIAEQDAVLPDGPWSEGWHPGMNLDYPKNLSLHANAFTTTNPAALAQKLEAELAMVNHISVFATGYGPTGAHDVHRRGFNEDGAIVIDPLSPKAHLILFRFSTDNF